MEPILESLGNSWLNAPMVLLLELRMPLHVN